MAEEKKDEQELFDVEETISKSEEFIENNKDRILIVIAVLAVIIGGYMYYNKSYLPIQEIEASEQMFTAEKYFETDSLTLALNGDGNNYGFLDIIADYSSTKSGNLASYYAGICYLKQGEFEEAINYLEAYNGTDILTSALAVGAIGDANVELGNKEAAVEYYEKAAELNPNNFTSPIFLMKAGELSESLGNYEDAFEFYNKIKSAYSKSPEASKVTKYIARVKTKD